MKRIGILIATIGVALGASQGAYATTRVHTVTKTTVAGPYKLMLVIGPSEMMSMHGMSGERMLGGHAASCHAASGGMSMHMGTSTACNHHVELHVYNKTTGHVLTGVQVVIRLIDVAKHMTIQVPIMTMENPHMGMADLHFGNNVYAASGMYTVAVTVNSVHAQFAVHVM